MIINTPLRSQVWTSGEVPAKRKDDAIVCTPECDNWIGVTHAFLYPGKVYCQQASKRSV